MSNDTLTCVWDGSNNTLHYDNDGNLGYNDLYKPWLNVILSVKTATANINKTQKLLRQERKSMISYDNIAKALYMKGPLRNINTIQIASNKNFVSMKFKTQQLMETFCREGLLVKGFNIEFNPDQKKPPPEKHLLNISFLNIPPETPEHLLTQFLSIYTDTEGTPLYVKK